MCRGSVPCAYKSRLYSAGAIKLASKRPAQSSNSHRLTKNTPGPIAADGLHLTCLLRIGKKFKHYLVTSPSEESLYLSD